MTDLLDTCVRAGSLVVVGTGIKAVVHITPEAHDAMSSADLLLYLVADPVVESHIQTINPRHESLFRFYESDKQRSVTYEEIVTHVVESVRSGQHVCVALYGHPTVFAYPAREAARRLRIDGYAAAILPGISAEDCLLADLGVDPGATGLQSFEATDFLLHRRQFDTRSQLVLWQVGIIGISTMPVERCNRLGVEYLSEYLQRWYPKQHRVTVYEAAQNVFARSKTEHVELQNLPGADVTGLSTLYIPPLSQAVPDEEAIAALRLAGAR